MSSVVVVLGKSIKSIKQEIMQANPADTSKLPDFTPILSLCL